MRFNNDMDLLRALSEISSLAWSRAHASFAVRCRSIITSKNRCNCISTSGRLWCYALHMRKAANRRGHMITVLNLKGGVGKTHTAWLTASVCQERRLNVLLVDTDTQGNLTNSFLDVKDREPGLEVLLDPRSDTDARSLIRQTPFSHIDIIPAGPRVGPLDISRQGHWERDDLHLSFVDTFQGLRNEYHYIVFDCPPRLSLVSYAALCACDGVIIPLEAADWGALGIMQVTEAIQYVQRRHNGRLRLLGYLVSRFRRARAYQQSYLQQLHAHFQGLTFDTVIPDLAQFEKSVTDRIPITVHAPRSEEADIARRFFDELEARLEGNTGGRDTRGRAKFQHAAPARA